LNLPEVKTTERIEKLKAKVNHMLEGGGEAAKFVKEIEELKMQRDIERLERSGYKNFLQINTLTATDWTRIAHQRKSELATTQNWRLNQTSKRRDEI
jgi:hypothetical protein